VTRTGNRCISKPLTLRGLNNVTCFNSSRKQAKLSRPDRRVRQLSRHNDSIICARVATWEEPAACNPISRHRGGPWYMSCHGQHVDHVHVAAKRV